MKVLVFAHELVLGGTPLNSIEIAAALRDLHGHDVVFFAAPGPMLTVVNEKGLRYVPAPQCNMHPSPSRMRAARQVVLSERPDVIHVWDWFQCLEAFYAVHLPLRVPMIVTDMFMTLTRVLPKGLPTTFGTPELVAQAKAAGRKNAELLLPPVDVQVNAPGVVDVDRLLDRYKLDGDAINLVTVSRLSFSMKFESIARTIEAVGALGLELPLRFILVGDGEARPTLERMATKVNRKLGRAAVVLTGEMLDPRPAYELANIVIGMGGSALRGMAFAKPVIVVGEEGFSEPFTRDSVEFFYYHGFFGRGDAHLGTEKLIRDIRWLTQAPNECPGFGEFARQFVVRHFSLETVSAQLSKLCTNAPSTMPGRRAAIADGCRSAAIYLRERLFLRRSVDRVQTQEVQSLPRR